MNSNSFADIVLTWYRQYGRALPWRVNRYPYHILLAEAIMQQTQIVQGLPRWHAFIEHYPTVEVLAQADDGDVMQLWQGLGYYQRARNLLKAARQIVALGHFPKTYNELRNLSGVGDYAAADITALAFGEPRSAIDGNAYRVMARCFGIETPINTAVARKEFTMLGEQLIPRQCPGDYNQAVMDFGALVCTPRKPHCEDCPLQRQCVALAEHSIDKLPVKKAAKEKQELHLIYIYVLCKGHTAFRRRPENGLWQGLWEPWLVNEKILKTVRGKLTLITGGLHHILSHRDIHADLYTLECYELPTLPAGYQWFTVDEASHLPKSRLVEKLTEKLCL